ncbi:uncharacterized protein [Haliotis cracherodii]|uniref:uncharacterized protein n=1 Tax=Haliotis cracherodii TaxID=6455 RepID=UPI0039E8DDA1
MMRAALLCLVVAFVEASESGEARCQDNHDITLPSTWADWGMKLWLVGECGKTIENDLTALRAQMKGEDKMEWEDIRERLDGVIEKSSKLIFHARMLFGPMLTMPTEMESLVCDSVVTFSKTEDFETSPDLGHGPILADAKCFSVLVRQAFTFRWMEQNKYSEQEVALLFMESVNHLLRLQHDGHAFHVALSKLSGRQDDKPSDSYDTDAVKVDTKKNILERLIKALKTNP